MVRHLPITKARINLGSVVKQVHLNKEYVVLEKDGIPIAAIMDVDEFEDYLETQDAEINRVIDKSNKEYVAGESRPAEDFFTTLDDEEKRGAGRRKRA